MAVVDVEANRSGDEGAPARIFQMMMAAQVATTALCAFLWLPRAGRAALLVVALQVVAAAIPIATILLLESR